MRYLKVAFVLICLFPAFSAQATKVHLLTGNLKLLKAVTRMNVEFDYSQNRVGEFATEQEYLKKKQETDGRGSLWAAAWMENHTRLYEPKFVEFFYKYSGISLGNEAPEKYKLIFKVMHTEPGYNAYVHKRAAEIDAEVWIVETDLPDQVVAKIAVLNAPGPVEDAEYDTGKRIQGAYVRAGRDLGKFIKKKLK